jgi:hypothetical protein
MMPEDLTEEKKNNSIKYLAIRRNEELTEPEMIRLKYSSLGNIKVTIRYIDNNNIKIQFIELIKDNIM